jgi:phosphotransferase system enzyme I (PtsI)
MLVGLGLRELSMEAAAIPEIKEALRRVTTSDCERAAEASLKLDTAEAVEELIAGTFAPGLFDLLTGNDEDAPYEEGEEGATAGRDTGRQTRPD